MEKIKSFFKKSPMTKGLYRDLKRIKDTRVENNFFRYSGSFTDRSRGHEKMCVILAGYKPFLLDAVFSRIEMFLPDDIDVCVVSSGKYSEELSTMCQRNNWSYLSTKENNVCLVQNVAISLHPKAQYIYKLDEDIFITEGYFQSLFNAYQRAKAGDYNPGIIAPLLLINGFTSRIILDKLSDSARRSFNNRFGKLKYQAGADNKPLIESNVSVARFLWGEDCIIPSIDELNRLFRSQEQKETACPIRFSIGAILFERSLWENMHYFDVDRKDKNMMGRDEIKICEYCMIQSRPIIVSENIVVGHFSFVMQTEGMKEFYHEHPERFILQK